MLSKTRNSVKKHFLKIEKRIMNPIVESNIKGRVYIIMEVKGLHHQPPKEAMKVKF